MRFPSLIRRKHSSGRAILLPVLLALACPATGSIPRAGTNGERGLDPILTYISSGWGKLTRSLSRCDTVVDPKLSTASVLYLPARYPPPAAVDKLEKDCRVKVRRLPIVIEHIKYSLKKGPTQQEEIAKELAVANDLGVKFIIPEQGDAWSF